MFIAIFQIVTNIVTRILRTTNFGSFTFKCLPKKWGNIFRELQGLENFFFHLNGTNPLCYAFHLEFDSQDAKQQLPHKLQLCLKILMKRHPLLRACVRQQPQSQPPRFFFCELQPTADGDVTPMFHIDETSDWHAVMEGRTKIEVNANSEALWNVVYLPNATSPLESSQEARPEAAFVLRFSHTIIDGQSESCSCEA